jgi:hypothetical protein
MKIILKIPNDKRNGKQNAKKCAYCDGNFYAIRDTAIYCSDSCKKQFNLEKNKNQKWYSHDPNKGIRLALGTITSWEMPEDKLVFSGDLMSIHAELVDYVSPEQLTKEKESIEILKPFSETQELPESSIQIFTDTNFIEVFRISPAIYKLYVWPWGKDNEKPYV